MMFWLGFAGGIAFCITVGGMLGVLGSMVDQALREPDPLDQLDAMDEHLRSWVA